MLPKGLVISNLCLTFNVNSNTIIAIQVRPENRDSQNRRNGFPQFSKFRALSSDL